MGVELVGLKKKILSSPSFILIVLTKFNLGLTYGCVGLVEGVGRPVGAVLKLE